MPKKQIQFLSRRNQKKKEMKNRLTRDVLAFEFFVDVVKRQKASSRFFCERIFQIPPTIDIYLTFIGGSVWIDSISKNSIIVVILGFRDDVVVSEVSKYGPRLDHI